MKHSKHITAAWKNQTLICLPAGPESTITHPLRLLQQPASTERTVGAFQRAKCVLRGTSQSGRPESTPAALSPGSKACWRHGGILHDARGPPFKEGICR